MPITMKETLGSFAVDRKESDMRKTWDSETKSPIIEGGKKDSQFNTPREGGLRKNTSIKKHIRKRGEKKVDDLVAKSAYEKEPLARQ